MMTTLWLFERKSMWRASTFFVLSKERNARWVDFFCTPNRLWICLTRSCDAFVVVAKGRCSCCFVCWRMWRRQENRFHKVVQKNLDVRLGDVVSVHGCPEVKHGKRIDVLPFDDLVEWVTGKLFDVFLKPYFLLWVINVSTKVCFKFELVYWAITWGWRISEWFGDDDDEVGGCRKQLGAICEVVEEPLRNGNLFKSIGVKPPRSKWLSTVFSRSVYLVWQLIFQKQKNRCSSSYEPPGSGELFLLAFGKK